MVRVVSERLEEYRPVDLYGIPGWKWSTRKKYGKFCFYSIAHYHQIQRSVLVELFDVNKRGSNWYMATWGTVIDTLVLDLGNNNSKEDVEATVKKTLKKRFSDSEITSNRNLRHGDDKEEDRYNYEICEQDVSTDRLLMLIGDRNEIQFANTDKKVPREEEEEGLFGPPSSFSTHPTTSYMSYDKNKPLARRGSIKFDYDNVDYDNPLASYEEENEYYDSDYYPDRPLRIDQVIGQESLQEEDHHLRSSTDPIYAQLLQYNMSSFKQERKESDNEEEEEEQEQDEEEDKQQQQQQERSLRRKVRNLKLDDVNKKKEEKLKQQRKSL